MTAKPRSPRVHAVVAIAVAATLLVCMSTGLLRPGLVAPVVERVVAAAQNAGPVGFAAFAVLQLIVAASGVLPASLLGVAAGAAYGLPIGFLLAAVGTMAGAVLAFALSRSLFRDDIVRLMAHRPGLVRFDALLGRDGWRVVCLLRVSPIMPFAATSYALGLSAVGLEAYMIGTVASLPALLGYVYIGTLAESGLTAWTAGAAPLRWAFLGAGAIATVGLTAIVARMARRALTNAAT